MADVAERFRTRFGNSLPQFPQMENRGVGKNLLGVGEAGLALGSGQLSGITSGWQGLGAALGAVAPVIMGQKQALGTVPGYNPVSPDVWLPSAVQAIEQGGTPVYKPRTEAGRGVLRDVSVPFELWEQGADRAGWEATKATDSEALGATLYTILMGARKPKKPSTSKELSTLKWEPASGRKAPGAGHNWAAVTDPVLKAEAKRISGNHLQKDGWAALEPVKGGYDAKGNPVVGFKKIPYNFHNPPGQMKKPTWQTKLANRMASDVADIVKRANIGDKSAQGIIGQARWYRSMRVRLRNEFGGMGDLFADVLGATSAQTNVTANWDNAIEVVRRFSRGDFDAEINAYTARIGSGEGVNPTTLHQLHNSGEFPLITKATGELFNSNSPAATGALVNLFRDIKAGKAPKTINFSGNLIGYSNDATIDVWAARYLRNISGKPYIPPVAEKSVAGKHLVGSTLENPKIGSEFGFAQKVFDEAVTKINEDGVIKAYDPSLGDLGADDLQAVVWFAEKEKWTANGWTTRAGEGGSLDFEASLAGSASPERIKELRSMLNNRNLTPAERTAIEGEINQLAAPLERTIVGISGERPGDIPSNYKQAEMAAEIDDVLRNNDTVVAYKQNPTYGRYMGTDERSLDVEVVARKDFDPAELTQTVIRLGQQNNQESVFVSHVVESSHPNARPGIEIYFTKAGGPERAAALSDKLSEHGIYGSTYVTDARQADRVNVQMGAGQPDIAAITGLRLQYIPEFDDDVGAAAWKAMSQADRVKIIKKHEKLYRKIIVDLMEGEDISSANLVHYDADVITEGDYDVRLK